MRKQTVNTLVVAGSAILAYNVSVCLGVAGHRVDVMGVWRYSPYRLSRFWRRYRRIDAQSFAAGSGELVDQIEAYCAERSIDFIVPADVTATSLILRHAARIGSARLFPMPDYELFARMHNKWTFSKIANACGAAQPAMALLTSPDQADRLDLAYPVVVKPLEGTGSKDVFVVPSAQRLRGYAQRCGERDALPLLVQQYVEGRDMDLTMLADRGRLIAWTLQERHPAGEIRFVVDGALLELGRKVIEHVGYHGVLDFDLRYDKESASAWLIDANPRLPGTLRYKLWAGVNLPDLALQIATGADAPLPFVPSEGSCTDYGVSPRHLLRALSRGRLTPAQWPPYTAAAWRFNLSDPLPHSVLWLMNLFRHRSASLGDLAQPLPPDDIIVPF